MKNLLAKAFVCSVVINTVTLGAVAPVTVALGTAVNARERAQKAEIERLQKVNKEIRMRFSDEEIRIGFH